MTILSESVRSDGATTLLTGERDGDYYCLKIEDVDGMHSATLSHAEAAVLLAELHKFLVR